MEEQIFYVALTLAIVQLNLKIGGEIFLEALSIKCFKKEDANGVLLVLAHCFSLWPLLGQCLCPWD